LDNRFKVGTESDPGAKVGAGLAQDIGEIVVQYAWQKSPVDGAHRLLPQGALAWHVLSAVAVVRTEHGSDGKRRFRASCRIDPTFKTPDPWALLGTVPAAKRWVETRFAKEWNPPDIIQREK